MDKNKIIAQQQEEVAFHQLKEQIQDVKLGYNQNSFIISSTRFISSDIPIGTNDFSVEYFGNVVGSRAYNINTISNIVQTKPYDVGCFTIYCTESYFGTNHISYILFEGTDAVDSIPLNYTHPDNSPFHLIITRQGAEIKVYINKVLKATKEQSSVKDFPQFQLGLANSSDCRFARMYNYALSATEVTQLYNNGKPEEYVLPSTLKQINTTPRNYDGQVMSYTWDDTHTNYYYYPPCNNKENLPKDTLWKVVVELSNYVDGSPFVYIGESDGYGWPRANGIYTFYLKSNGVYNTVGLYGGLRDISRHLTLTLMSVSQVGCIAEYLSQNLITSHDGQMYDITPIQWLDSAKQLPINNQYLPPLRGSIGEYDLTANGTPEIVQKPILTRVINAKNISIWFSSTQTDATSSIVDNIAYCNCGSVVAYSRPAVTGVSYPFIIGKKYRVTTKYTLIKGDVHLHGIGNWQTDAYQVVQSTYDTEIKQYSWDSGIIPYDQAASTYNRPFLYFGNSVPNSEFSIDEMTIYEYN